MVIIQQEGGLFKATVISFLLALIALVTLILPAEYNLDPTGIGQKLGLTELNQSEGKELDTLTSQSGNNQTDSVVLTVPAGRGIEYKLAMKQFQNVKYEWQTDAGDVYVDLHGEPKGDTTGYFESFAITTADQMKGSLTVPFEGSHGWYWKNSSDIDIQIQLTFSGEYVVEGLK